MEDTSVGPDMGTPREAACEDIDVGSTWSCGELKEVFHWLDYHRGVSHKQTVLGLVHGGITYSKIRAGFHMGASATGILCGIA
jgi:hypothetical protein